MGHPRLRASNFGSRISPLPLLLIALLSLGAAEQEQKKQERPSLVPDTVELAPTVRRAIDDDLLTDAERNQLRLRHGQLHELPSAFSNRPEYALATWDLDHSALHADDAPAVPRARAALRRGDLHRVPELLGDDDSPTARWLRGQALEGLGQFDRAIETLAPLREAALAGELSSAEDLTAGAQAVAEIARLEGRPARDYQRVMNMLGHVHQAVDRLHWPALLAEARLLISKDNREEAIKALHQALRLNPRASRAWYQLGRVALDGYNFTAAWSAVLKLRNIQPHHPLAEALEARIYLLQKDPRSAQAPVLAGLARYPNHRQLLACAAASAALTYDDKLTEATLDQFDAVAPGHPLAMHVAGYYLSKARQYEAGREMLRRAIERQPNWTAPLLELGMLLNQAGRETQARQILTRVRDLDPFNKRAANTLKLLERLADYEKIETDHFIIKYKDPIDRALAADMTVGLERMYDEVTDTFSHEPRRKTLIEILPDKRWFAIRITGMPEIWTIGAATGPVIAMTPPREGGYQAGSFDWPRVIRHEFVHTVTLDRTNNRIPHWFTEACAVSQEPGPRAYQTCKLLADALENNKLFDLDEINWAFVRPKTPQERPLAYAQSHWMYQYITQRFGHQTILDMLDLCRRGTPQAELIPEATGQSEAEFLTGFKTWARKQVQRWGLAPDPPAKELLHKIADAGSANASSKLDELLKTYPDHPALLKLAAERALKAEEIEHARDLLLRYAEARPVDTWADRKLAQLALDLDRPADAVSHLQRLDSLDQQNGQYAEQLLKLFRQLDRLDDAQRAARRTLARRPYDANIRETAATLALQRNKPQLALRHLRALTDIEPDRAVHFTRLAALHHKLGQTDQAHQAATQARELDKNAPVAPFLKEQNPSQSE